MVKVVSVMRAIMVIPALIHCVQLAEMVLFALAMDTVMVLNAIVIVVIQGLIVAYNT